MARRRDSAYGALIVAAQLLGVAVAVVPGSTSNLAPALENAGESCLDKCGGLSGPCGFCGAAGGCCMRGNMSDAEQCFLAGMRQYQLDGKDHECVLLPAAIGSALHAEIPSDMEGDCLKDCGLSGYCPSCGAGNACCSSSGVDDPPECYATAPSQFTADAYQCVQPPLDISSAMQPLQNAGQECDGEDECPNKGYCSWCGTGNACCRSTYKEGDPIECLSVPADEFSLDAGAWECVAPLAAQYDMYSETEAEEGPTSWAVFCSTDCHGENECESDDFCSGEQTEFKQCPNFEECTTIAESGDAPCIAKDCVFSEWTEWEVLDCTGLCNRTRTIQEKNECNGEPCLGSLTETTSCESSCAPTVDCQASHWSDWSSCDDWGQRERSRTVQTPPRNGGAPCDFALKETDFHCIHSRDPVDCEMGPWIEWSGCSTTCDQGQQFRVRSINQTAKHGGKPCIDQEGDLVPTHETRGCNNTVACSVEEHSAVDCELTDWGPWDTTECEGDCGQKTRMRDIKVPAANGGRPCELAPLSETAPCSIKSDKAIESPDCQLSDWTPWTLCSKTCGGGQTYRSRNVLKLPDEGGKPCDESLKETKPCSEHSCVVQTAESSMSNCAVSEWTEWGPCSVDCGVGYMERNRSVVAEAYGEGLGCSEPLSEVIPCPGLPVCEKTDCQWTDWTEWDTCTLTCGGGTSQRQREVIVYPVSGGKMCEALDKTLELKGCNKDKCPAECVDAVFGDWGDWTPCTETCGGGLQWRNRPLASPANDCGKAADGNLTEFQACSTDACSDDKDCVIGEWVAWSTCTESCNGLSTRVRNITEPGSGRGKSCTDSLEESKSCNVPCADPALEGCDAAEVECKAQDACSDELLDATFSSNASYAQLAAIMGICHDADAFLAAVKVAVQCPGFFEAFPKKQKVVFFQAIQALPNDDDKCAVAADMGTALTEWTKLPPLLHIGEDCYESCNSTAGLCSWCGSGHACCKQGEDDPGCANDIDFTTSEHYECVVTGDETNKVPEVFTKYLTEDVPACPCQGGSVDCAVGVWSDWSSCSATCQGGQMFRTREVVQTPSSDGAQCNEHLSETAACEEDVSCDPNVKSCAWADWEEWGACTHECGGDRTRHRSVAQEASQTGHSCVAHKSVEVEPCDGTNCTTMHFCVWEEWGEYGDCSVTCGSNGTRARTRTLAHTTVRPENASMIVEASTSELKCKGEEVSHDACVGVEECDQCVAAEGGESQECVFYEWSEWGEPSVACTGLCERRRDIDHNKTLCGTPCTGALVETMPCEQYGCDDHDCKISEWEEWSKCTSETGQKTRTRKVTRPPKQGGKPCEGTLSETEWCKEDGSVVSCTFAEWGEWTACSQTCGTAQRSRSRQVASEASGGGAACKGGMEETQECPHDKCPEDKSEDCVFGQWEEWNFDGCDGKTLQATRERTILTEASGSGDPCTGNLQETQPCPAKALEFCEWGEWHAGACSWSCQGGERARIRQEVNDSTKTCVHADGFYKAVEPCNEEPCAPDDCQLGEWSEWGGCTSAKEACGPGSCYQSKTRQVVRPAKEGGHGCDAPLELVRTCDDAACTPCEGMKDCEWAEWSEWGECHQAEVCGDGYRKRSRGIKQEPDHGGLRCDPEAMEEVMSFPECPGSCAETCIDAEWGPWAEWSSCSVSCGPAGYRSRSRTLVKQSNTCGLPATGDDSEYEICPTQACADAADCEFSPWQWEGDECVAPTSPTDPNCNSFRTRTREVASNAAHGGSGCSGSLQENVRCAVEDPTMCRGAAVDCELSAWSEWSVCDSECGQGHQTRERNVLTYPQFNGTECDPVLKEIVVCNKGKICPANEVIDCQYSPWQGACEDASGWTNSQGTCQTYADKGWCVNGQMGTGNEDKFGAANGFPEQSCCACGGGNHTAAGECNTNIGQLTKYRKVIRQPSNGGKPCTGALEMTEPCEKACPAKVHYCSWGEWEEWSECSTACGPKGRIHRKRRLVLSDEPQTTITTRRYDSKAVAQLKTLAEQRPSSIAVSFVAGFVTLVLAFGLSRFVCRDRSAVDA